MSNENPRDLLAYKISLRSNKHKVVKILGEISTLISYEKLVWEKNKVVPLVQKLKISKSEKNLSRYPRGVLVSKISSRSNNFKVVKMMRKISTKSRIFLWEFNMDKKTKWSHRFKNENFQNLKEMSKKVSRDVSAYKISSKSNNFKVVKIRGEKLC